MDTEPERVMYTDEFNFSWEQKREFTRSSMVCPHPDAKPLGWFNSYMFGWLMPEVFAINGIVLSREDFTCLVLLMKFLLLATNVKLKHSSERYGMSHAAFMSMSPTAGEPCQLEVVIGPKKSFTGRHPMVSHDTAHDTPIFTIRAKSPTAL